ncbi:hypothetical protein ACN4EE_01245 [Geminocystis sp. CENA526]|uniref:hypothetical protein n=1 Tax=Geminocystis sp. CENA526 TaxID=1355871 RepID=UPI003D6FBD7F
MTIIQKDQSYTFSKIFELKAETDEFVAEFGFSFQRKKLDLSQYKGELDRLQELKDRIEEILPYVSLSSELSRREILISRVMTELVHYTNAQLRIEYSLKVSEQLQGSLDYLIYSKNNFIVIEAKNEDLVNGFTQLTAELIALDKWEKTGEQKILLGAVTTGNIWQFGCLNRSHKIIEQDLNLYVVPDNLEPLMRILIQALI